MISSKMILLYRTVESYLVEKVQGEKTQYIANLTHTISRNAYGRPSTANIQDLLFIPQAHYLYFRLCSLPDKLKQTMKGI